MTDHDHQRAALAYARAGWPVFPLVPGEKVPLLRSNGLLDASTDAAQIAGWWARNPERNVGIATGAPGPDVLDVDKRESGTGFAAYRKLQVAGLVHEPLAIVRTPSGGFHAYFAGTDQRSGSLPEHHVDFRAEGGYVVAPPSLVSGRRYEVAQHQRSDTVADWPAIRYELDREKEAERERKRAEAARRRETEGDRPPASVTHLADWVARQPEGNRNHGLFWAANRAVEAGDAGALEAIGKAAEANGLDKREVDRTIRSAQQQAEPRPFGQPEREAGA